jgi:epoxyqueuosine reductase
MSYLAEERARLRRADPQLILPVCKSILVLAVPYSPPSPSAKYVPQECKQAALHSTEMKGKAKACGRIAAYAWGEDYHEVLPERMKQLVAFIEAQVGHPVPNRWYTDSGPILERDLAQRGGLGWIGKNTCLIHPRHGSYFLLAEVLLGLELDPDPPFITDYCGTCTRCLDTCPTHCIQHDRTLDARRCISYLTIELKDEIPTDLSPHLGDWIFGCDICQMVCPWNRFANKTGDQAFSVHLAEPLPVLIDELSLTLREFNQRFNHSPVKRAKRLGYLRNVATVLGNQGDASALPALERSLQDPELLLRTHAAMAINQIKARLSGINVTSVDGHG